MLQGLCVWLGVSILKDHQTMWFAPNLHKPAIELTADKLASLVAQQDGNTLRAASTSQLFLHPAMLCGVKAQSDIY